jgi:hypothetical protein
VTGDDGETLADHAPEAGRPEMLRLIDERTEELS